MRNRISCLNLTKVQNPPSSKGCEIKEFRHIGTHKEFMYKKFSWQYELSVFLFSFPFYVIVNKSVQVVYLYNSYCFVKLLKNLVNIDLFLYNNLIFTLPSLSLLILLSPILVLKIWKINWFVTWILLTSIVEKWLGPNWCYSMTENDRLRTYLTSLTIQGSSRWLTFWIKCVPLPA